jgi:hypothetical protein
LEERERKRIKSHERETEHEKHNKTERQWCKLGNTALDPPRRGEAKASTTGKQETLVTDWQT